jgi:hypothetical protein
LLLLLLRQEHSEGGFKHFAWIRMLVSFVRALFQRAVPGRRLPDGQPLFREGDFTVLGFDSGLAVDVIEHLFSMVSL